MKFNLRRLLILLLILALSVGFGFGFDGIATTIERHNHPQKAEYAADVASAAAEFSVPEPILWAAIKCKSNFSSNAVGESGEVGLFGLTVEEFRHVYTEYLQTEAPESGMRYDPATSIYCGAARISELYERYGVWSTTYAALHAGTATVDGWLQNPDCVDAHGRLKNIPDPVTEDFVRAMERAVELYRKLYYGN